MSEPEKTEPVREQQSVSQFFREAWSQALVKVGAAEDEASRVLEKAGELAGWGPEEVRKLAAEFTLRLQSQRKEVERSLDEGVRRGVARLRVPHRDDLEQLWRRLDRVSERIDALTAKRGKS